MDLSVITVTWNNEENIEEQIKSVFSGCKNVSCEEIVVDNGSSDETVNIVKGVVEKQNIASVQSAQNIASVLRII